VEEMLLLSIDTYLSWRSIAGGDMKERSRRDDDRIFIIYTYDCVTHGPRRIADIVDRLICYCESKSCARQASLPSSSFVYFAPPLLAI
jgi:hypothetical protein